MAATGTPGLTAEPQGLPTPDPPTERQAASAPRLTAEQQAALATRDRSVALSAGAGCGKTFVLTQRFLSHLDPVQPDGGAPAELDQLIAITFTERAAREMRDRVRKACRERVLRSSGETAAYWMDLLRSLDAARISTFHAFCGDLLKAHAVEAGIDADFAILEETQSSLLKFELAQDVIREGLAERRPELLDLVAAFGVDRLPHLALDLLAEQPAGTFDRWCDRTADEVLVLWERALGDVWGHWRQRFVELPAFERSERRLRSTTFTKVPLEQRRQLLLEMFVALRSAPADDAVWGELPGAATVRGIKADDCGGDAEFEQLKEDFKTLRDECRKLREKFAWDRDWARAAAEWGLRLCRLTRDIRKAYDARKSGLAVLDFDDLVRGAHDLLAAPDRRGLRQSLGKRLRLLLVDEFQDTDGLQADLLMLLMGAEPAAAEPFEGASLFFVGDRKQSIYRFRGAEPKLFEEMRFRVANLARLPLSQNFRSRAGVLHFVNHLFVDLLDRPETPYEPLRPGPGEAAADLAADEPAVEFLWALPQTGGSDGEDAADDESGAGVVAKLSALDLRIAEAEQIALRIRELIGADGCRVHSKKAGTRPARLGDVVILLRAMSDVSVYETALRRYDLPSYTVGGHAFYSQQEIFDLVHLLRAVLRPTDDLCLLGALRSPFFNLPDEALFLLVREGKTLADAIRRKLVPEGLEPDDVRKLRHAHEVLTHLGRIKDRVTIVEFLHEVFDRTGFDSAALLEFLGERKLANLDKLFESARTFDRTGMFSLDDFAMQLSEFLARRPPEAPAPTEAESCDVVRIMTIHQSKGLEFPIVILADCGRPARLDFSPVGFAPDLGPLLNSPRTLDDPDKAPLTGLRILALRNYLADEEEALRVLYVALTRAADRLIVSAGLRDFEKLPSPWLKALAEKFDLATGTIRKPGLDHRLRDILGPDDHRPPRVRVRCNLPAPAEGPPGAVRIRPAPDLVRLRASIPAEPIPAPKALLPIEPFSHRPEIALRRNDRQAYWGDVRLTDFPPITSDDAEELRFRNALIRNFLRRLRHDRGPGDVPAAATQKRLRGAWADPATAADELAARFLRSPRAAVIRSARSRLHGVDLVYAPPCPEMADGQALFHGTIDCLYEDGYGRGVLIEFDFALDESPTPAMLSARHGDRLAWLAETIAVARGEPLAEAVVHAAGSGTEVVLRPLPEWKARAENLRNAMLERLRRRFAAQE